MPSYERTAGSLQSLALHLGALAGQRGASQAPYVRTTILHTMHSVVHIYVSRRSSFCNHAGSYTYTFVGGLVRLFPLFCVGMIRRQRVYSIITALISRPRSKHVLILPNAIMEQSWAEKPLRSGGEGREGREGDGRPGDRHQKK